MLALLLCALLSPALEPPFEAQAPTLLALILGVNDPAEADQAPLHYADDDAARFSELMQLLGGRVWLLTHPDRDTLALHPQILTQARPPNMQSLEKALEEISQAAQESKARDALVELFFIYSGHGVERNGEGALTLGRGESLSGQRLRGLLIESLPVDRLHMILDACNSHLFQGFGARGPGGRPKRIKAGFSMVAPLRAAHVGLLLSTRDSRARESYEWDRYQAGVFSHLLRSGLSGAADIDGDGRISYAEVGAFIKQAGVAVPNPQFRPQIHLRSPQTSAQLLDLRPSLAQGRIEVGPGPHRYLENRDGVRLMDFHPAEPLSLLRPLGRDPLYLRSADELREWRLPKDPIIQVAQLSELKPSARGRGAEHHAFRKLFSAPLGRPQLQSWGAQIQQPSPPEAEDVRLSPNLGYLLQSPYTAEGSWLQGLRLGLSQEWDALSLGGLLGFAGSQYQHLDEFQVELWQLEMGLRGEWSLSSGQLRPLLALDLGGAHTWQQGEALPERRAWQLLYRGRLGLMLSLWGSKLKLSASLGQRWQPGSLQQDRGLELVIGF